MNWSILSVALTTFAGGAAGYLTSTLGTGLPSGLASWEAVAIGAAMAGLAAVVHLYQPAPVKS
jgi:hypothetical protein